jgi:hypothetical protein
VRWPNQAEYNSAPFWSGSSLSAEAKTIVAETAGCSKVKEIIPVLGVEEVVRKGQKLKFSGSNAVPIIKTDCNQNSAIWVHATQELTPL